MGRRREAREGKSEEIGNDQDLSQVKAHISRWTRDVSGCQLVGRQLSLCPNRSEFRVDRMSGDRTQVTFECDNAVEDGDGEE